MSNPSNPPKPGDAGVERFLSVPEPAFPTQGFPVTLGPEVKQAHSVLEARILQAQHRHQCQADQLSQMAQVLNRNPELAELIDSLFYLNPNPNP
jgi:hypothetical protein